MRRVKGIEARVSVAAARIAAAMIASAVIASAPALAKPRRPPPPQTCEKPGGSRIADRQAAWAKLTDRSFHDALAREQLTTIKLTARALAPSDPHLKGVASGATFKLGDGSAAPLALRYGSGTMWSYGTDEFVQDAQGVIHPLVRTESVIGSESHTVCGCGPVSRGGAVPPPAVIVYVLPDGASVGAPIELAYDAKHVYLSYLNLVDGVVQPCPLPP